MFIVQHRNVPHIQMASVRMIKFMTTMQESLPIFMLHSAQQIQIKLASDFKDFTFSLGSEWNCTLYILQFAVTI